MHCERGLVSASGLWPAVRQNHVHEVSLSSATGKLRVYPLVSGIICGVNEACPRCHCMPCDLGQPLWQTRARGSATLPEILILRAKCGLGTGNLVVQI